jgi:hypothetical protein
MLATGFYSFRAAFDGDGTYLGSDGPCESLRLVDAILTITPATATNPSARCTR